jgi:hypothetical protein
MPGAALLLATIEDNIGWCSTICASHHSEERNSASTWANLVPSPPYYPNIITRRPHTQADVVRLVQDVRQIGISGSWCVKDSFGDLDLSTLGFSVMIEGQWFGRISTQRRDLIEHAWETVRHPGELSLWERAWGGPAGDRIFNDTLLDDRRIRFWMLRRQGGIGAGCITFSSGRVTGLSNWFSIRGESVFDLGVMSAIADTRAGTPVVCWAAADDAANFPGGGFAPLGRVQVWISAPAPA